MPEPVALNARRLAFRNRGHATEADAVAIVDALVACVDEVRHAFEGREPAAVEVKW